MQMTIGQVLDKIDTMRIIVREIENGCSVDYRIYQIADLLDEYILVLSNTKIDI